MTDKKYFDDINHLSKKDLGLLTKELECSLSILIRDMEGRISTGSYGPFIFTQQKPNTARIVTPFYFNCENIGDLYIIAFLPNDGTGDDTLFNYYNLRIPEDLKFTFRPERVYPRKKGCESEVFFPFFSVGKNYLQRGFVSLDVLTTNTKTQPPTLVREFSLGASPETFAAAEDQHISLKTHFQFTVDGENSYRFGDPHSVFYNGKLSSDRVQVVGFLELPRSSTAYTFFKERISQTPQL